MPALSPQPEDRRNAVWMRATARVATQGRMMTQTRQAAARSRWEMRRASCLRAASVTDPRPTYRVEHRTDHLVADLGPLEDACPHHAALAPFTSFLRLSGAVEGEVVLIDIASGRVVARRALVPLVQRAA